VPIFGQLGGLLRNLTERFMNAIAALPAGFRRRREKVFGEGRCQPLDRNAKARIMVYARAWSARHKQPGQHRGPLTRAYLEVLEALLWGFHNSRDGRCFPSYETIAARAQCCRDTVYEAIKALEGAEILTWVNRLIRVQFRELDLFGKVALRSRLIRTSNAYTFRDPLPCAQAPHGAGQGAAAAPGQNGRMTGAGQLIGDGSFGLSSKSENPPRTQNQDSYALYSGEGAAKSGQPGALDQALAHLKSAMEGK
jgi:hypothetical protein